tara:strand:+ start:457 stop:639 length:183 start_codon:yes stop_codon:yes gene_type:complete
MYTIKENNMGKQNKTLLKNIQEYEQKKKAEQQKSEILGQKPVNRKENKRKKVNVYNSSRC